MFGAGAGITQTFKYTAYGQLLAIHDEIGDRTGAVGQNNLESLAFTDLLYVGEAFDSQIGQHYLRARWYSPTDGRFASLDPFGGNESDPLSLHKYAYASGDSVNNTDPSGRFSLGGVSASIGIAQGLQSMYNGTVVSIGEDIISTLLGTQVYLDPMGWLVATLLDELFSAIEYPLSALRSALPILEMGVFLESDETGQTFALEEQEAINWASVGMHQPDPDAASAAGGQNGAVALSAAGTNAAVKALTRSLAKYPLKLIAQTGKKKLYAASHYMLGKFNRVKTIASTLWQRNHISQDALFKPGNIRGKTAAGIPYGQGMAVNMRGAIADKLGHYDFHLHLDDWMDKFRNTGKFPKVSEYNDQMEKALGSV